MWCRYLDTYSGRYREQLLQIEVRLFNNIKTEIQDESGSWEGTRHENFVADLKIAESIYNSFRAYERGMKRHGSFFDFSRI